MWLEGGTTIEKMIDFVTTILNSLPHGNAGRRYCFTMDNLNAHHNRAVAALIHAAGHRLIFRAPYYPVDGPIEYVFNTLQCIIKLETHGEIDGPRLVNAIGDAIQSIDDFAPYFVNCGFWRN